MLKSSIQIVSILMAMVIHSQAVEVPIAKQVELEIPIGQFVIIDLPFKIADKPMITSFQLKKNGKEVKSPVNQLESLSKTPPSKSVDQPAVDTPKFNNTPIDIQVGQNNLTLFGRKEGKMEMVVWGYEHPVMITLVVDGDKGDKYYGFYEPNRPDKEAVVFENDTHKRVLARILKSLHLESAPAGYKSHLTGRHYTLHNIGFTHAVSFVGNRYAGETWFVQNDTKSPITLYNEMFYDKESGTYLVAIENDRLLPNEKTRLFVIRDASKATGVSK